MQDWVKKVAGAVVNGIGVVGLIGAAAGLIIAAPFVLMVLVYMFLWMAVVAGPFLLWEHFKEADDA